MSASGALDKLSSHLKCFTSVIANRCKDEERNQISKTDKFHFVGRLEGQILASGHQFREEKNELDPNQTHLYDIT